MRARLMADWASSPVKEPSGLEEMEELQKARAFSNRRPMSSPLRQTRGQETQSRMRQELKSLRDEVRQAKLELKREKTDHDENVRARILQLESQALELELDLDVLIEEESQVAHEQKQNENTDKQDASPCDVDEQYNEELEDFLAQEELELEAQLRELSLL